MRQLLSGPRPMRVVTVLTAVVALSGCFSGEEKVAEADQVPAAQAEALAAAAEAGPSEAAPGGEAGGPVVEFVAVDIAYEAAPETVPAGGAVFQLDNQGNIVHNVVIEETGQTVVEAEGGQTATGPASLEPGSYTYFCDIAGHRAAGMEGTFEVQ